MPQGAEDKDRYNANLRKLNLALTADLKKRGYVPGTKEFLAEKKRLDAALVKWAQNNTSADKPKPLPTPKPPPAKPTPAKPTPAKPGGGSTPPKPGGGSTPPKPSGGSSPVKPKPSGATKPPAGTSSKPRKTADRQEPLGNAVRAAALGAFVGAAAVYGKRLADLEINADVAYNKIDKYVGRAVAKERGEPKYSGKRPSASGKTPTIKRPASGGKKPQGVRPDTIDKVRVAVAAKKAEAAKNAPATKSKGKAGSEGPKTRQTLAQRAAAVKAKASAARQAANARAQSPNAANTDVSGRTKAGSEGPKTRRPLIRTRGTAADTKPDVTPQPAVRRPRPPKGNGGTETPKTKPAPRPPKNAGGTETPQTKPKPRPKAGTTAPTKDAGYVRIGMLVPGKSKTGSASGGGGRRAGGSTKVVRPPRGYSYSGRPTSMTRGSTGRGLSRVDMVRLGGMQSGIGAQQSSGYTPRRGTGGAVSGGAPYRFARRK